LFRQVVQQRPGLNRRRAGFQRSAIRDQF
jgi:hypothetical protein